MAGTYCYDPAKIGEEGVDRMRFELGDTMVEGGAATCALTDQEYRAVLAQYPGKWKRAKLALVESILRRFAFEVDVQVEHLSLSLRDRREAWEAIYRQLKAEVSVGVAAGSVLSGGSKDPPYFYAGMHDNPETGGTGRGWRP